MNSHPNRRGVLAALSAFALHAPAPAASSRRRVELPLPLAVDAPPEVDPTGYLVSEKYDGVRACWDGAVLRFRSGAPIAAPPAFIAALPPLALDGELWMERGRFEATSAAVRRAHADEAEWRDLRYLVFELPGAPGPFAQRAGRIAQVVRDAGCTRVVAVSQRWVADRAALQRQLDAVVDAGGEGLVLHRADAPWRAGRSGDLLKLKPLQDAEAVVVGHEPGRGRLTGRVGALRVRSAEGAEFSIGTGLTDALRENPPPTGAVVTYRYRGRTAAGVPRFASFWRLRDV